MNTVYIETTIPSYYHETRRTPTALAWREATRRWWDHHRHQYRLVTSAYVLLELDRAPAHKASRGLALVRDLPIIEEAPGFKDVVQFYIDHHLMPADALGDAAHLALASMGRVDFMLTWNCRHLANANKIQHIEVLNGRLGLPVPIITTPLTLITEEDQ